jgi:hypothetical protein
MNDIKQSEQTSQLSLDGRAYRYTDLNKYIATVSDSSPQGPAYVYDIYSLDLVDRLYVLQNNVKAANIIVLFKESEVEHALRHINIFNNFSFTMVPEALDPSIYEKLFSFYLYSQLSEVYITWLGSLIFRYRESIGKLAVDAQQIRFSQCDAQCPLLLKNCSKGALFTYLFHPLRSLPSDTEMDMFCSVQREYSSKMASAVLQADTDIKSFENIRKGIGIHGSQYWLDPLDLFSASPHPYEEIEETPPELLHRM